MSRAAADAKLKPEGRHNENGVDDSKKSLRQIAHDHGKSVISLLLDIQREKCSQEKSIPFLKKLECLGLPREYHGPYGSYQQYLPRRLIDAFECRDYVALSYTWAPRNTKMLTMEIITSNATQESVKNPPCSPRCETACSAVSPST